MEWTPTFVNVLMGLLETHVRITLMTVGVSAVRMVELAKVEPTLIIVNVKMDLMEPCVRTTLMIVKELPAWIVESAMMKSIATLVYAKVESTVSSSDTYRKGLNTYKNIHKHICKIVTNLSLLLI